MNKNTNMYDINIENSRAIQNNTLNQNPYINQTPTNVQNMQNGQNSGFNSGDFIKGALIGAAVTYLLTNKGAQENIMKAVSKGTELFQAGMEELKERMEDAKAAMEANQE
ncbi:YtxH domain-containing protein [Malaciobacter mytili]|uniref:YtxH domain-containing protein n=1 Tax=Malaciobacter mytili TaxID=603050 RepID=UPI003A869587